MGAYKGQSSSLSGAAKRKIQKDKEAVNKTLLATIQNFHILDLDFRRMHLIEMMMESKYLHIETM